MESPVHLTDRAFIITSFLTTLTNTLFLLLSLRNLTKVLQLLFSQPNTIRISLLMCLTQVCFSFFFSLVSVARKLAPWDIPCMWIHITEASCSAFGIPAMLSVLLIKAYYMLNRDKIFLVLGAVMILLHGVLGVSVFFQHRVKVDIVGRCTIFSNTMWININLIWCLAVNIMLNVAFLVAVRRNRNRVKRWNFFRVLFRDGVVYTLAIILSNVLAALGAFNFPSYTVQIYAFDYMTASTLLVQQFINAARYHKNAKSPYSPAFTKPYHSFHDSSTVCSNVITLQKRSITDRNGSYLSEKSFDNSFLAESGGGGLGWLDGASSDDLGNSGPPRIPLPVLDRRKWTEEDFGMSSEGEIR